MKKRIQPESRQSRWFSRCFSGWLLALCLVAGLSRPAAVKAATITVTSAGDTVAVDGLVTLREAIQSANANADANADVTANRVGGYTSPSADTINFNIAGNGVHSIALTSALPSITDPVVINGYSQPGASQNNNFYGDNAILQIQLDGTSAGANVNGLTISAGACTIEGLVINHFKSTGIVLITNGSNSILGNFIGTDANGTGAAGNGVDGVFVGSGSGGNLIGSDYTTRNVISSNGFHGVDLNAAGTGNVVRANYIGTDKNGTAALGNGADGVVVNGTSNAAIGGNFFFGTGNLVSGNTNYGVEVVNSTAAGNVVQGNSIGTDASGSVALPNGLSGAILNGAPNNVVGGTLTGVRNLISGNGQRGVIIAGGNAMGNKVQGNYIGTDGSGTVALGNHGNGVLVFGGASNTLIGGSTAGARNIISGNLDGIWINFDASNVTVQNNYIGLNSAGTAAIPNSDFAGILVLGPNNVIGGSTSATRNVISGNSGYGIEISGGGASGNTVQGNYIGTNAAGTVAIGNGSNGVVIVDSPNNVIGGSTSGVRNVIAGNIGYGIEIADAPATGNTVQGNYIGTDASGNAKLGNFGGVFVAGAPASIIGGPTPGAGNLISGNNFNGLVLSNNNTTDTIVQGNYIGTNAAGTAALGNSGNGVELDLCSNNIIGGIGPGTGNLISGNAIGVDSFFANNNILQGNLIGTAANGTSPLGNTANGISFVFSNNNVVGGSPGGGPPNAGNIIAFNAASGITTATGSGGAGNSFLGNSIFSNGGLGIDLDNNGVTPNDTGDADTGSNNLQNYPVIARAITAGSTTTVVGSLNSLAKTTFTLEFFANPVADPSGFGEGQTYLDTRAVTTDAAGNANFSFTLPLSVAVGQFITATATNNATGDTSEFAQDVAVTTGTAFVVNSTADTADANPGDGACDVDPATPGSQCTLRAAIQESNALPGLDTINFNIPGGGVQTITPASALPVITQPVIIDGFSQPGSTSNTLSGGSNATMLIELNGTSAGGSVDGLRLTGGGSTVRGLVINHFSGNAITLDTTGGNVVEGCYIGTNPTGTTLAGNGNDGIFINGIANNIVGGLNPAQRMVVAGNSNFGVAFENGGGNNQLLGTYVGLNAAGTAALGNVAGGVNVTSSNNSIGGLSAGARNLISGNGETGLFITGAGVTGNVVQGNYIGTDITGTFDLGNVVDGIVIDLGAGGSTIGGTQPGAGNLISGNNFGGVDVAGPNNTVQGNLIGTDVTGNVALPNSAIGLFIQFASGNLIGGNTSGARNVISGNSGAGVVLSNNATGNTVAGNFIGVGLDGSTPVANTGDGVQFFNATSNNVIGGPTAADGNIIANNGQDGVTIAAGTGEAILSNSIFSNGGNATNAPGIDLGNDGVTPNDAGDVDTGPNNLQNFPVLTSAVASGSTTTVTGTLNSTANTAFTVQFFSNRNADPSGHGEGQTLLATRTVTTNGSGNAAFSLALPGTVPFGQFITATATDPGNNTSEFSNDLAVDTPGSIQFSANAYSVAENVNGGNTTITVTRSGGSAGSVTVPIVVTPGTATNGTDYSVPTSGQPAGVAVTTGTPAGGDTVTLTFGPGEVSKSFLVNVIDDTLNEPNETVNFTLGTPGGGAITGAQTTATLTIVDNDPAPTLSINNVTTPEGNVGTTNATFTVTLSAASGKTVTVDYATAPGTATANVDYQSRSGTLTFNPGETTKNIVVPIIGDTLNEGDETYSVTLSNVANGVLNNATGVGTIADDDAAPSLAVNDVTVAEGNSGPTNAVFTVSLSAASGQTVTVDYATADGTATAGSDYQSRSGTLTFAPGETSKTVAVIVNGDTLNEPDETFTLVLSDPTHATIADNQGVGTITNDDSPPSLSINDVSVPEGDSGTTPATFTVSLSAASGQTVTVKYATADGTATAPADYAAASGTLTFAAGETAKTVTVAVQGDTLNEANETFTVLLSGATNATIARTTGIGTILDDDAAAFKLSISPNTFSEGAGANAATGTVTRNTATTTAQVVNLASSNTNKATVPATVTIPVGATFATFSINAVDNTLADGPTVVTITAGRTGFTGDAAQVTVVDNDGPTLTLTISPNTFSEGAGANAAVGTVTRNTSTSAPLVVSLANSDATKVTVPATVTIPAGAASVTFPVGAVDNSVVDGNKTVTLTATSSGLNAGVASVTVTDNDVTPTPTPAPTPTPTPTPDTTAPTVTIDVPRNGDIVSSLTAVIGTATDASGISRVDLLIQSPAGYWTGSGWAAGLFPLTTTLNGTTWTRGTGLPAGDNLVNGTYTLQAIAYDKAGNAGSTSITITVDKTAPTLTFTLPNNTFVSNLSVVAGQVVDNRNGSGVARVELLIQRASDRRYWNGTTFVTTPTVLNTTLAGNTWSRRTGLPAGPGVLTEGRYYLLARAYDQAGLVTRAQISVIVDTTPPTATFTAPLDKATLKHLGPITGTASDNRGGSGLLSVGLTIQRRSDRRYWNGTAWVSARVELITRLMALAKGTFTWSRVGNLPAGANLLPGDYDLTAVAHDRAGNAQPTAIQVTIAAPTVAAGSDSAQGNATAPSSVALSLGTAQAATGSVTLRFTHALQDEVAGDAGHYKVAVNGSVVPVESAAYNAKTYSVTLSLPDGALRPGDVVTVEWDKLQDAAAKTVSGHAGPFVAR